MANRWGSWLALALYPLVLATSSTGAGPSRPERVHSGPDDWRARADTFLSRASQHGLSGAVLVARGDSVLLAKAYGMADRASSAPLQADSPFFIGSVAKGFTAAAILRLEADGKLAITDSLKRFFPDAPPATRNLTLAQLLQHASGLPYLPTHGLFGGGSRDSVRREMLAEPVVTATGAYGYSSVGYALLGAVIERASGQSYESFLTTRFFTPLGMTGSGFIGDSIRWQGSNVQSYSDAVPEPSLAEFPLFPRMVGAGSIVSTVPDLFRWYRALAKGSVLPKKQVDELFTPAVSIRPGTEGSLAWSIVTLPTGRLRLLAGDIGGFNAEIRHYLDENLIIVFASNRRTRGHGDREVVMNALARIARGDSVALPPAMRHPAAGELRRLAGRYSVAGGGALEARVQGDSLLLGALDGDGVRALADEDAVTRAEGQRLDSVAITFVRGFGTGTPPGIESVDPSIPADAAGRLLADIGNRLRNLRSDQPSVLGSLVAGTDGRTFLCFPSGANASQVVELRWRRGRLNGVSWDVGLAGQFLLASESTTSAVAYDLFNGRTIRLRLDGSAAGLDVNGAHRALTRIAAPARTP